MLTKLFRDNIDSKNPATRKMAVERLEENDADHQLKLVRTAMEDTDDGVRCTAIGKVSDPLCLSALLGDSMEQNPGQDNKSPVQPSASVAAAARTRLEQLLSQSDTFTTTDNARLAASGSLEACVLIACHSVDEASRNSVLIMLDQQADIARVVSDSRYHSTRAAAAEKLTDEQLMSSVANAIKERDKVVARSLQEKLDQKKELQKRASDYQAEVTQLTAAMQQLSESVWSPQYAGRFAALEERWRKLDPAPQAEARRQFESFRDSASVLVEESKNRQMARDFCSQALKTQTDLARQLKKTPLADLHTTINRLRQESSNAQASWRVSVETATPDNETIKTYDASRNILIADLQQAENLLALKLTDTRVEDLDSAATKTKLEAVLNIIGDPEKVEEKDRQYMSDAAVLCKQLGSRNKQLDNENEAKAKSIQKQLGALAAAIKEGKWSPANSLYARIDKKLARLEGHKEQKSMLERLARHKQKLDELADWQNFAAKPKLESLCEQMESLPAEFGQVAQSDAVSGSKSKTADAKPDGEQKTNPENAEPQELAGDVAKTSDQTVEPPVSQEVSETAKSGTEKSRSSEKTAVNTGKKSARPQFNKKQQARLQTLANRIKELQQEWKSIGPSPVANELWDRFKAAADLAYEPVGVLREIQKEDRETRQKNKETVCAELDAFLASVNWEEADWKQVERTLRNAKNRWRDNRIQDRKPDRALEQRFSNLVSLFNEKLNVQYDNNAAAKEELIEKVQKLSESEINQHVVNQTRKLQNSWKQSGITRRKQDQELWEKFNGFCRQIYKQHHAAEKQKTDSGLVHVKQARDIIRAIKDLCKQADADDNKFSQLQEQFNALAEFPPNDKKFLLRDFNQASLQFSRLKEKSHSQAAKAEWAELERKSALCVRMEAMVGTEVDAQALEDVKNEWEETTVQLPKTWEKKISRRKTLALSHISNKTQYDFAEGEKNRRLLCIQAEILSGKETPSEDKQLRMAYQLENLQQGLGGSAVTDTRSELKTMAVEWLSMPPGDPANRERLESRFQQASK